MDTYWLGGPEYPDWPGFTKASTFTSFTSTLTSFDVEIKDKKVSKPVAPHFNLPDRSSQHLTICGLSLHQGNTESREI